MEDQGNFLVGIVFGTTLSVPLWIGFLGCIKLAFQLLI